MSGGMTPAQYGATLRSIRRARGVTQAAVGEALEFELGRAPGSRWGQVRISRLERGHSVMSEAEAAKLGEALSRIYGTPIPAPPVDRKAGVRGPRGARKRGAPLACPHCGGSLG